MPSISLPVINQGLQTHSSPFMENAHASGWNFDDPGDGAFFFFEDEGTSYLFIADGSRIYSIDSPTRQLLAGLTVEQVGPALSALGIPHLQRIGDDAPKSVKVRSFSLAIAQKCNLGCTYCYAQEGDFGSAPRMMPLDVALAAVDRLFKDVVPRGERIAIAFMGGEPLLNREVLQATTRYAAEIGEARGVPVAFSITTNGTLVTPQDADFFERFGFSVTVSIDGNRETHDRLRPHKGGRGSYDRIVERIRPLLEKQSQAQVAARVTVTPQNLRLVDTLSELIEMGFYSVGFSPMLSSPTGRDAMNVHDLSIMLEQMIACGREFERRLARGQAFPFSNLQSALHEIHRGTHRPYPCGAGGGYMGVSADGDLFACHRFVDDADARMGDLKTGVDAERQEAWLRDRHVHRQQPCGTCWARYLCGGGCHHEVMRRGRMACDYIRGWLEYCLGAYTRISRQFPDFFLPAVEQ
jgi:uncharacterized protein